MEAIIHGYLTSYSTLLLILVIAAMLYLLSKGADILVDEAVSLSLHLGVPKLIIGATIVSLGTTLPEATVSVLAAINGNPDLALGNAIGSIIANTSLIIGLAALIGNLPVDQLVVRRQGKIKVWSGILLAIVSLPFFPGRKGIISQWVGWLFIVLLIIYIYISIKWSKNTDLNSSQSSARIIVKEKSPVIIQVLKLIIGIILVIGSSKILIPTVEITAIRVGIPQSIIAATLVAFGTSLPELVTAITAVRKGHGELAIGNVVGADILNVLFVIGAAAAVTPVGLSVPATFYKLQIPMMLIIIITFRIFSKKRVNEKITIAEGLTLFILYVIYIILNYVLI